MLVGSGACPAQLAMNRDVVDRVFSLVIMKMATIINDIITVLDASFHYFRFDFLLWVRALATTGG